MPCAYQFEPYDSRVSSPSGCQFDVPEDQLISVDDEYWCEYHLPLTNKKNHSTDKVNWWKDQTWSDPWHVMVRRQIDIATKEKTILNLTGVVFPCDMNFSRYEWPAVTFEQAVFYRDVNFYGAKFNEEARFCKSVFMKDAIFTSANFRAKAVFSAARFSLTSFYDATFSEEAWFPHVQFNGMVNFNSSGKSLTDEEVKANQFPLIYFNCAKFKASVTFENRQFLQGARFFYCSFHDAPNFHGCKLHEGTDFPSREDFHDVTSSYSPKAYRTLKLAMEQHRARREEGMFYALEMESRRSQSETPFSEFLVSTLYKWTADYGESFTRPLRWLVRVTIVFALLYQAILLVPTGAVSHLEECAYFAIEQLVRPFSAWLPNGGLALKEHFGTNTLLVVLLQIAASVQSLASLGLITLFILALRRRFKLG